ncbi:hypothetical protein AAC387_Pa12g1113 [Persea americana]
MELYLPPRLHCDPLPQTVFLCNLEKKRACELELIGAFQINCDVKMADHNPSPLDGSVLYNQENHISEQIWKGKERGPLRAIPVTARKIHGSYMKGSGSSSDRQIKLKWIRDNFTAAPKTRIKDHDKRRTRAYLFSLVAAQIVPSSGGSGAARKPIRGKRNKGKDEEASSKTLTGPLQLLQIWAYSCIRIGRPISEPRDWKVKIQFPLCKMWARRLRNHHHLTSILEAHTQLDSQTANEFVWTPYNDFKGLSKFVNKTDKALFTLSTILINFWVAKRHCTKRDQSQWEDLISVMRKKVSGLKAACAAGFENYTLDDSVHNQPDDERMKKQKLDVRIEEKVHSPPSVNVDQSFLIPKLPQCYTSQHGKALRSLDRDEKLYLLCIVVDPENMRKLLGNSWIDNFAMDFWLDSLKEKFPYAHMFATYLSMLWINDRLSQLGWGGPITMGHSIHGLPTTNELR